MQEIGVATIQNMAQAVETLSGDQRHAVAVVRASVFGSKIVILDEPTAALGVRDSDQVLNLIRQLRDRGLSVVLISHHMSHLWEVSDRVQIQRLGGCAGVITPHSHAPAEDVNVTTGAEILLL